MKTLHHQSSEGSRTAAGTRLPVLIKVVGTLVVLSILFFMWRDLSSTRDTRQTLQEENEQLRAELEETKAAVEIAKAHVRGASNEPKPVVKRKKPAPVPPSNTLKRQKADVRQVDGDLVASLSFVPTGTDKLDLVALVVRLPRDSGARILGLKQTGKNIFNNVKSRVDASGKFAIIQGTPTDLKALKFDLTVTAPVKATVRGSTGIKPFEIDIGHSGSNIREL